MKTPKKQIQVKRVTVTPHDHMELSERSVDFAREQLRSAGRVPAQSSRGVPSQRRSNTGFIVGGVLLVALSLFQIGSRSNRADAAGVSHLTEFADEYDGVPARAILGESFEVHGALTRPNPEVSSLEMFFCRGRQTSTACSGKAYHPYLRWWQDWSGDPTTALQYKEQAVREITATFGKDTYAD